MSANKFRAFRGFYSCVMIHPLTKLRRSLINYNASLSTLSLYCSRPKTVDCSSWVNSRYQFVGLAEFVFWITPKGLDN